VIKLIVKIALFYFVGKWSLEYIERQPLLYSKQKKEIFFSDNFQKRELKKKACIMQLAYDHKLLDRIAGIVGVERNRRCKN